MRVLVAEDDPVSERLLEVTLEGWGYRPVLTRTGTEALRALRGDDPPAVAILDWMMPELDGVEVCRRIRAEPPPAPPYLILLTAKGRREDLVAGLAAGADDYVVKPFDREELQARLLVGVRVARLQLALAERVRALEEAVGRVARLQGLLPMCAYCKKIRNDRNYWQQVESYISEHSAAQFSHGICPDCYERVVRPEVDRLRRDREPRR
jgi:DNA-binding response OmpR family regulator